MTTQHSDVTTDVTCGCNNALSYTKCSIPTKFQEYLIAMACSILHSTSRYLTSGISKVYVGTDV